MGLKTLKKHVGWYKTYMSDGNIEELTLCQIKEFGRSKITNIIVYSII